jgi:hypothetical protein
MRQSHGARAFAEPLFQPVTPGRWWSTTPHVVSKSAGVSERSKHTILPKELTQASEQTAPVSERTNNHDPDDLAQGSDGAGVRTLEARGPAGGPCTEGDLAQGPADDVLLTTLRWVSERKASVASRELDFATWYDAARSPSVEGSAYAAALKDLRARYEETEASLEGEQASPANTEYLRAECEIAEGQAEQLRLRAEHAGAPPRRFTTHEDQRQPALKAHRTETNLSANAASS